MLLNEASKSKWCKCLAPSCLLFSFRPVRFWMCKRDFFWLLSLYVVTEKWKIWCKIKSFENFRGSYVFIAFLITEKWSVWYQEGYFWGLGLMCEFWAHSWLFFFKLGFLLFLRGFINYAKVRKMPENFSNLPRTRVLFIY